MSDPGPFRQLREDEELRCEHHTLHLPFTRCHSMATVMWTRPTDGKDIPLCGHHAAKLTNHLNPETPPDPDYLQQEPDLPLQSAIIAGDLASLDAVPGFLPSPAEPQEDGLFAGGASGGGGGDASFADSQEMTAQLDAEAGDDAPTAPEAVTDSSMSSTVVEAADTSSGFSSPDVSSSFDSGAGSDPGGSAGSDAGASSGD